MVVDQVVQKFFLTILIILADVLSILIRTTTNNDNQVLIPRSDQFDHGEDYENQTPRKQPETSFMLLVDARGVAGMGKVSGDGQSGSDKVGQQVPSEVYNALSYAGSAFLLTLSAPVILYSLNKVLNKIEDCFGCGPSSKKKTIDDEKQRLQSEVIGRQLKQQQSKQPQPQPQPQQLSVSNINGNMSLLSQPHSMGPSTDSTAITLPVDYYLNYNMPALQQNLQQPPPISSALPQQQQHQPRPHSYIISTPHL